MAKTYRKQRVVGNPGRRAFGSAAKSKKKYKRSGHARHSNPGDILGFTLAGNPGRRKATMAQAKKKSKTKKHHHRPKGYSHHRTNMGHMKTKRYHHRKNAGIVSGLGPMVTNAAFVIIGAVGTKLATQAVLGAKNVGLMGYAGNAAVGGVLWFLTEKFMKNRTAATGILSGTIVQILLRMINDYTPLGQYVNQLGMGDYQMQSFVTPQVLVDPWRSAEVQVPNGWGPAMPLALPAAPGRGGAGGGPATSMPSAVSASGVSGLYGSGGGWGPGLYSA